jgi:predicted phage terminase large subunit-like protein
LSIALTAEIIEGFAGSLLRKRFDNPTATPAFHRELWSLFCEADKYIAAAAPRGHAKSTAITHTYTLATTLFRVSPFTVIVSDTETQSVQFLNDIKMELTDNEDLLALFPVKKFHKFTENDIVAEMDDGYMFRILAKGSEQSLRGIKWNGMRPKLIVCDDMENDELVMNKERREKFFRWIYGALIPCLAPDGRMRIVGTVLHLDSFLENCLPKEYDKNTVKEPIKSYSIRPKNGWRGVRYKAHDENFDNILWPQRFSEAELRRIRADYTEKGIPDVYSQEYLNYPLDPTKAYFKRKDFLPTTYQELEAIAQKKLNLRYYVAVDLAISEKERSDWSAFEVFGMDENGLLFHIDEVRERMDARDIIDTIFLLDKRYQPEFIAIESEKITKALGPFLHEEMMKRGVFPNIVEITPHKDLWNRARSFQGRHRAGLLRFNKSMDWYPAFEEELCTFPRGIHDDRVAACAVLGLALERMVEAPTPREVEEEEYLMEAIRSDLYFEGRNATTGY